MKTLKNVTRFLMVAVVGSLVFATLASAAAVEIRSKEGLGDYLTDEKGMTLYIFKKDTIGKSVCSGSCVEKWPFFYSAEAADAPEGLKAGDFGVLTREDGKMQTSYKGLPLYYFFKDVKSGDTAGQGFNNVWYVVAP